jgi:hypothetical protein
MKLDPMLAGIAGGLAAALLIAPFTGTALGKLAEARAARVQLQLALAASVDAPLVADDLAVTDSAALATRIRTLAKQGGVLVEAADPHDGRDLARVRLRVSGAEKAVIALADALERGTPLVRLRAWRIDALDGGSIRLAGEAVAVRQ